MQKDANYYIDLLLSFYNLSNLQDLANQLGVKQPSISSWKKRNSVNAIKKKCRELGIYNEIFGDQNIQTIGSINGGQVTQKVQGDQNYNNHPDNHEDSMKYNIQHDDIDAATFNLFLEAYAKSLKNNDVNDLRVYLMDY